MLLLFCDILLACVHQILSQVTFSLMENKCTFVTYIKFFLVTYRLVSKGATLRCPDRETHLLSFISIGSSSLRMVSSVNCVVNIEGFPYFNEICQLIQLWLTSDIPVFPEQFSIRDTSSAHLNCIALDQPGDREWRTKYLCYKPALKRLTITWSRNGEITNQDCVNTRMPHVRSSRLWEKSYLCLPRNSLLKLSWSTDGPLKGKGCLEVRRKGINGEGYFLCGTSKYKKIGVYS